MRIVFVGAGKVSVETAKGLIKKEHEIIIIESDQTIIDELSEEMDCSFLHGDGSQPKLLHEVNPTETDFLFCLTENDQNNVIGSLIGRSLGFKRVVTSISDPQFENICSELGLTDIISPSRTISAYLDDIVTGSEDLEVSPAIKNDARLFIFTIKDDTGSLESLNLPKDVIPICYYRGEDFFPIDKDSKFMIGDEIVVLTHSKNIMELQERWKTNP